MARTGRPPVDPALKAARGTLEKGREAKRLARGAEGRAVDPAPVRGGSGSDYVAVADAYVHGVIGKRVVAGQWTVKAARRYLEMRRRAMVPGNSFYFSPEHAADVCAFAEECPHVEGKWASDTVRLEAWQVFILVACYGFRVSGTGARLVTVVFFQVARKSAKSTLVAIAALYHLAKEREPGGQVICAATTGQQARIVFSILQRMVRKSAYLRGFGLQVFANAVTLEAIGANARPINAKSSTQDGLNPSFISLDESHAQTFELRDVLISAMGARPEGVIWCPTTAGYDLTSVGYALRTTAQKILDGVLSSDHSFVALYELDEQDDWRDERVWQKAAPMIGISPTVAFVQRYCVDAQQTPGMQGEFETKMCNRWLHSASRWLRIEQWDACADPEMRLESFAFEKCWIGVDLAERDDIAAVALNFRTSDLIISFVTGFLPREVVQERVRAVPEYLAWTRNGDLEMTEGNMTDHGVIEAYLRECCTKFDVQTIVIERYGAAHLVGNLTTDGLPAVVEGKNARVFTPPMKELEIRLKTKRFRHTGASFLRWQASNVCVERRRDGSLLATKDSRESPNKIDAMDAIFLGIEAMLRAATVNAEPQIYIFGGP